jgi:hypothetical protein
MKNEVPTNNVKVTSVDTKVNATTGDIDMTVIAWDGETLAADRMALVGNVGMPTCKIEVFQGDLLAITGDIAYCNSVKRWYKSDGAISDYPRPVDADSTGRLIVIRKEGVYEYESGPDPTVLRTSRYARGSGRDFALTAMHLGKSAEDAVRITCELCTDCGLGVDSIRAPWL